MSELDTIGFGLIIIAGAVGGAAWGVCLHTSTRVHCAGCCRCC